MIALKADIQESYLTMNEFRSQQHDDIMHNAKERAASSERTQAVFDEIRDEFKRVNHRVDHYEGAYRKLKNEVEWIKDNFVQRNFGTFGKGPAPANYGKSSEETTVETIEPQEEVLEESLACIEPILEMRETDTEFHDLEEMEADKPEEYEILVPVPINDDWKNVIHVVEAREEEV